jgi:hypothetical protein
MTQIKGKIHAYSNVVNAGIIICEKNNVYLFNQKDWLSEDRPAPDVPIIFIPERKWARSIRVDKTSVK